MGKYWILMLYWDVIEYFIFSALLYTVVIALLLARI